MLNFGGRPVNLRSVTISIGILAMLVLLTTYLLPGKPEIDPRTAVSEALKNTEQAKSYEYSIKMSTNIDGKEEITSNVAGERESATRIHFSGKIFDSDVDFYLIDSDTYYQDQLSGDWTKMNNGELNQQEIFMQEINPLAAFRYKELQNPSFVGTEKVNGSDCWVYTAKPVIDNPYMEILWRDFGYKFWISPGSLLINKAQVTAVSKNKTNDKLNLVVEFKNYRKNIEIEPPK